MFKHIIILVCFILSGCDKSKTKQSKQSSAKKVQIQAVKQAEAAKQVETAKKLYPHAFITKWNTHNDCNQRLSHKKIFILTNQEYNYDYNIEWGDGTPFETHVTTSIHHEYAKKGEYIVTITGLFPLCYDKLRDVIQWGDQKWHSMAYMFTNNRSIKFFSAKDAPNLAHIKSVESMFYGAESFNQPLNSWDVSNVKDMSDMFSSADSFNQPLNSWDVSNVTNMREMFYFSKFNQAIDQWKISKKADTDKMCKVNLSAS